MLHLICLECENKMELVRLIVIFQDRPMLSVSFETLTLDESFPLM